MKPQSAKAKGRNLQKWVVGLLLKLHPSLEEDDVKSTPMGVNGEDVQFSPAARKLLPYSIECKSHANMSVYSWYKQACQHIKKIGRRKTEPVVVIKANRERPLVVIDAEYFFRTISKGSRR